MRARGVELRHGRRVIVADLDLEVGTGRLTSLVGPNGSGKSTVLRAIAGLHPPAAGSIEIGGRPIEGLKPKERATRLSLLPQDPAVPAGLTVREVVELGRHPHRGLLRSHADDPEIVERSLADSDVAHLADRRIEQISGGERQRVWLATALAQDTALLLLDEPTTFLDLRHQLDLLALLRHQVEVRGRSVIVVLHDLNLAADHADELVVLHAGAIVAQGSSEEVLADPAIGTTFGVEVTVGRNPVTGLAVCFFERRPAVAEARGR